MGGFFCSVDVLCKVFDKMGWKKEAAFLEFLAFLHETENLKNHFFKLKTLNCHSNHMEFSASLIGYLRLLKQENNN